MKKNKVATFRNLILYSNYSRLVLWLTKEKILNLPST